MLKKNTEEFLQFGLYIKIEGSWFMNLLLDKDKRGQPVQLNDLGISLINDNFNFGTQM